MFSIEVFLCFLSLTDKYYYQIKNSNDKIKNFCKMYQDKNYCFLCIYFNTIFILMVSNFLLLYCISKYTKNFY